MSKLLDQVQNEKVTFQKEKFKLLVDEFNKKPDDTLSSEILMSGKEVIKLNNINQFIENSVEKINKIKNEINLIKSFKINSHPPSHDVELSKLINPEMTGGDYNGSILSPFWINECNSQTENYLTEEKNIVNSL